MVERQEAATKTKGSFIKLFTLNLILSRGENASFGGANIFSLTRSLWLSLDTTQQRVSPADKQRGKPPF